MVFYWTVTSETQYSNKLPSKYHLGLLNDWYTNDIPNTICPLYKLPSILILFQHCIVYFRCFPIIIHVGISQFFPVNSVYKNNKSHKQTLKCLRKIWLDSKYGEGTAFQHTEWRKKKWKHHRGYPNHGDSGDCHSWPGGQEWTVNELEFQPSPKVTNSSCNSWRHLKY